MSLDVDNLRRKAKLGNNYARRVLPLRENSHLTLASILLANVAVISATSLVLEKHFNGWLALLISTLLIVVFGEVLPQAFFARNALRFTGRFEPLLRALIVVTYPVSKPLQLLLAKLLGPEKQHLQSRSELGIMIAEHSDGRVSELDNDEVEIMQGALQLSEKKVGDIMTEIGGVYWLTPETVIDGEKIHEIKDMSRSRVPVFDEGLSSCHGLLLMKDLINLDFRGDPRQVKELTLHPSKLIGYKTALDTLFRKFIASGTHLLPVERDDKIVGIVTIEDLIEEIVGHEIEDETDRAKNRS